MTENQEKQMMSMLTKCVNGIQRLEEGQTELRSDVAVLKSDVAELKGDVAVLKVDVAELKGDVAELKSGQARMEKDIKIINKSLSTLAENSLQNRSRIEILEDKVEHIN